MTTKQLRAELDRIESAIVLLDSSALSPEGISMIHQLGDSARAIREAIWHAGDN